MTSTPADPAQPAPAHGAAGEPVVEEPLGEPDTGRGEQEPTGATGYQSIPGMRWQPIYDADEVKAHVQRWAAIGWGLAGSAILVAAIVAAVAADDDGASAVGVRVNNEPGTDGVLTLVGTLPLKDVKEGLSSLTAARALVFAGAFLLSVAAVAGAVGLDDDGEGQSGSTPTPTPTGSTPAENPPGTPGDDPASPDPGAG